MSAIIWNMRGFGNTSALVYLKNMLNTHRPFVLGILEPKQQPNMIEEYAQKINYPNFAHFSPLNTHIWLFWLQGIQVTTLDVSEQHVTVLVGGDFPLRISFVYAKCLRVDRNELWNHLRTQSNNDTPWIVGGDFNTILRTSEKRGGVVPDLGSIQDFQECLIDANLSEISYEGSTFTWCNNQTGGRRIWQRLDRVLCNGPAAVELPELKVKHLHRMTSDHAPLLISMAHPVPYCSQFIFQRMWMDHPDFQNLVEESCKQEVRGSPSFRVAAKLRQLQFRLKSWNWNIFGDLNRRVEDLQKQIFELELQLQSDWPAEADAALSRSNSEMRQTLNWDAELRFQKTRSKWLQEGDRITQFFHAVIRERRRRNMITLQEADGKVITDPKIIAQRAVDFFENLFTASPYFMHEELFDDYPREVTEDMNAKLIEVPTTREIWDAVSQLSPDSAPGVDGFTGHFFRVCWQIIQSDIVEMIQGFFLGDYLHHTVTSTSLTLIPKIDKPRTIVDYRPISLSTFASKIVSKILASRLADVLPCIINEQ